MSGWLDGWLTGWHGVAAMVQSGKRYLVRLPDSQGRYVRGARLRPTRREGSADRLKIAELSQIGVGNKSSLAPVFSPS